MRPSWGLRFSARLAPDEQLDARDDRLVDDLRDHVDVVQHAVDAQPHQRQVALGLEVDVRGALLEGVAQDVVERLHHRRRRGVEVGRGLGQELLVPEVHGRDAALAELLLGVLQARLQVVEALVDRLDVAARRHHAVHLEAGDALHVLERERGERVVDRDRDPAAVLRDRHHAVAARERARDRLRDHVEVEVERVDLHVGEPGVGRQRLGDLRVAQRRRAGGSPAPPSGRSPSALDGPSPPARRSGTSGPRGRRAAPAPRAPPPVRSSVADGVAIGPLEGIIGAASEGVKCRSEHAHSRSVGGKPVGMLA